MTTSNGGYARASFDIARLYGEQGELWVVDLLDHLRTHSPLIEVKRKSRHDDEFFIEFEKLSYGKWVPSGIAVTEASVWFYVIDDLSIAAVFPTDQLRLAIKEAEQTPYRQPLTSNSATQRTKGWVLSMRQIISAKKQETA